MSAPGGSGGAAVTRPSFGRMMWRGIRRRCPWCGGARAFFTGWFAKADRCRACGLRWRRGDVGFELGAASISAVLVLGLLVTGLGVGIVATWPDVPYLWLAIGLGAAAIVLPIVLYPVTYTVWQALDLVMRPPQSGDGAPPSVP